MQEKKIKKKKSTKIIERERTFLGEGKLCKEWKREWWIYSKIVWIRRDKIREYEEKDEK